ncbi:hypothetical protein A7U60_g5102 [Sanghuangporus baumii]|uniref:Uncharacterized protein n=1 Tax=Sanghuangporus baumii TaxID=108892 RepID=A0A9Q5HXP5_SANBA|nr:hypothetical protein A7U60_g5102 [Sanghuangporus baumii]
MASVPDDTRLPPEIWIRVFYWATYCTARDLCTLLQVPLFDGITYREDEAQDNEALQTKSTLALVCKQWKALSEQYLYEDLRIRHGKQMLADVLEASRAEDPRGLGKGRYVIRILLPNSLKKSAGYHHNRHWADEETSCIMDCCPNLLALCRYHPIFSRDEDDDDSELKEERIPNTPTEIDGKDCCSIHDPPLPSFQRLDWFNGEMRGGPWRPTICAVPSALWSAQQLEVLSLSGDNYFWGPSGLQSLSGRAILLPKVHTLRVGSRHAFGVSGISDYTLVLPSLRRIILERGEALHHLIECVVASARSAAPPDVTALEVGTPHWRFMRSDYISTLIRHYPTAETLHYPIFFARPLRWRRLRDNGLSYGPHETERVFANIRHIGLHAEPNPEITYPIQYSNSDNDKSDVIWSHLYAHARALLGSSSPTLLESRLPGIHSVTLHGQCWLPLVTDTRFHLILDLARTRGAEIVAQHPSVANVLQDVLLNYRTDLIFEWVCAL